MACLVAPWVKLPLPFLEAGNACHGVQVRVAVAVGVLVGVGVTVWVELGVEVNVFVKDGVGVAVVVGVLV